MPYDISGKAAAKPASSKPAAARDPAAIGKIAAAGLMLIAGVYLFLAGNQGWPPFATSVKPPEPASASEKQLMEKAPKKTSEIPNIQQFEALPEKQRPVKAGS
jgi:hypothetical protein